VTIAGSASRRAILAHLKRNPTATVRDLGKAAGCSASTALFHLRRLQEAGYTERVLCSECGRPKWRVAA
jgi:predicted ArsR family transcriptional regulator